MTAQIAEYFTISAKIYNIRARILRQSKLNEYIIIGKKLGDGHWSWAENPMAHALSCQWPFGKSKLDFKQSSLRRVRSNNLKLASWRVWIFKVEFFRCCGVSVFLNAHIYSIRIFNSLTLKKNMFILQCLYDNSEISKGRGLLVVTKKMQYLGTTFTMKTNSNDKILCGNFFYKQIVNVLK
jgi:hypothetical protein